MRSKKCREKLKKLVEKKDRESQMKKMISDNIEVSRKSLDSLQRSLVQEGFFFLLFKVKTNYFLCRFYGFKILEFNF
jgi:hypothetical protein